jgi:hypothetical protein
MKKGTRCAWLLMLFLALGIAAREAPEIHDLADDVSNDGVVVGCEKLLVELIPRDPYSRELVQRALAPPPSLPNTSENNRSSDLSQHVSRKSGKVVLKFLSLRRE